MQIIHLKIENLLKLRQLKKFLFSLQINELPKHTNRASQLKNNKEEKTKKTRQVHSASEDMSSVHPVCLKYAPIHFNLSTQKSN